MLKPRIPFLVSLLAGLIGAIVAKPAAATLKAIFDVTVQDFWKDTIAPYLSAKLGPWSTSMLEAIGPYWAGFGSAFLIIFLVEMVFAWRRSRLSPTLENLNVSYTETRLKLRLDPAGTKNLLEISQNNVSAWRQSIVKFSGVKENGEANPGLVFHTDTISMTFDRPINYDRPIVEAFGHQLGGFNFYPLGTQGAVFQFYGGVQAGMLEIWFPPIGHYAAQSEAASLAATQGVTNALHIQSEKRSFSAE